MSATAEERHILRELAQTVAEIALLPIQTERIRLWQALNRLEPERAMVLTTPQEGWHELMSEEELRCRDPLLRRWEWDLRWKIYRNEHIFDDFPVTADFPVKWVIDLGDYGVTETRIYSDSTGFGAYRVDPPIKTAEDFKKLRPRRIAIDREETARQVELADSVLGDILEVRREGENLCRNKLTRQLIHLRGFEQFLLDFRENPALLQDLMSFLREEKLREWKIYEQEGLLDLNNRPDDNLGSGGLACTDLVPGPEFDGRVKMRDMWCFGESQETIGVSPEDFDEFVLAHQLPLMLPFRLVDYGCCEPLDTKVDLLIQRIPNLHWLAVHPWANRERLAERMGGKLVYAYKPHPSNISSPVANFAAAEHELRETLEIARGCCVSLTLKGTLTFYNEPERLTRWTEMAQRVVREMA